MAENEAGTNDCCYEIVVHYAPVIHYVTLNNTIADVNTTTNFTTNCEASGFPEPQVRKEPTYFKGKKRLLSQIQNMICIYS